MKSIVVLLLSGLCVLSSAAAEKVQSVVLNSSAPRREFTGNLQVDFFGQSVLAYAPQVQSETASDEMHYKSPWLAAGLSAVLPGAGEFYAENYWKAALFLAVDVAAWSLAYSFDKKGNNQTDFFQGFADQHWSVVEYAKFSRDKFLQLIPENRRNLYGDNNLIPGSPNLPPWQRVNWNLLNALERDISSTQEGKYYSHTLPPYGEQQYYELIGKYKQFNQGWDDAPTTYTYPDPVTTKFDYYAGERGKANDYYSTATTYVTVAVVNHVLSALDAAWTASTHNHNIHASMQMQTVPTQFGFARVPVARVEYSF
jgi:hypothetical protein